MKHIWPINISKDFIGNLRNAKQNETPFHPLDFQILNLTAVSVGRNVDEQKLFTHCWPKQKWYNHSGERHILL